MADTTEGDALALDRVTPWLTGRIDGLRAPLSARRLPGGRSNLTYLLADADGRQVVLRRPPVGELLPSAHDMGREHRLIDALAGTPVPVPQALAFCPDESLIGARFYVMEFVQGTVLRRESDVERGFDVATRAAISDSIVDTLADLHALEPDAVGLGELGRREGYVARQLHRWNEQFEASRTRPVPAISEAHRQLVERIPPQRRTAIVHGDYRLDNCIIGADGGVRAVLDWELATLGDPLADLGLLLVYWSRPGDGGPALLTGLATTLPGFRDRAELIARYTDRAGARADEVPYYLAFGYWKLACIFEGIHARLRAGIMRDETPAEEFAAQAAELGEAALSALRDA